MVKGTGEIKDTFKFTYDGKDYRWLSNSERIKAGLEIAMLGEASDRAYISDICG